MLLRRFNPNVTQTATRNVVLLGHRRLYGKFGGYGRRIGLWFSEHGIQIARSCTRQFEFIAAQRVRRGVQLFHLYTKIWEEVALKEFLKSWRRRMGRNAKQFFIGAAGVTVYNWDGEKITDEDLNSYSKEIEGIYKLRDATVVCDKCNLRLVIDATQPGVEYCVCHGPKTVLASMQKEIDWEPFIERKDMLVWRKEEPNTGGLYAYKVFGSFSDVSADEFLRVQVDVDYRKEWDPTARRLEIIDSDPKSSTNEDRQSDVVYWEMAWPRLFSNRDYVYERRWVVDRDGGIVVIVSKATNHPNAPDRPDTYRVTTYWSYMVIKPCRDFHEPGIEFGLTYFDDPGVNIPSAVTAWVAMSGLPDFLCRMREAAKDYKAYTARREATLAEEADVVDDKSKVDRPLEEPALIVEPVDEPAEEPTTRQNQKSHIPKTDANEIPSANSKTRDRIDDCAEQDLDSDDDDKEFDDETTISLSESKSEHQHGYLRYFFLTRLFA